MSRSSVSSSNLRSVGYENGTLEVELHGGRVYQYYGVGYDRYADLMNASSKGSYLASHIKGHYRYRRIR